MDTARIPPCRHRVRRLLPLLAPLILAGLPSLALRAAAQDASSLRDGVEAAERAFAATMAARDLGAFATFLAEDAVFFGAVPLEGRDAVVEGWTPYFQGEEAPFSWEPEEVVVLASGRLAHSSGPVRSPTGERVGTFNSVWRLEDDGRWRVVFDKGCPSP